MNKKEKSLKTFIKNYKFINQIEKDSKIKK